MHLSIVLAIVGVASAAATGPNIWKRDFCADNCSGSFDANGGGDCANVEMCTNNCHACSAKSMDFSYGGCGCIEKGSCDEFAYDECRNGCDQLGNEWQIVGCWATCAKQNNCLVA